MSFLLEKATETNPGKGREIDMMSSYLLGRGLAKEDTPKFPRSAQPHYPQVDTQPAGPDTAMTLHGSQGLRLTCQLLNSFSITSTVPFPCHLAVC